MVTVPFLEMSLWVFAWVEGEKFARWNTIGYGSFLLFIGQRWRFLLGCGSCFLAPFVLWRKWSLAFFCL